MKVTHFMGETVGVVVLDSDAVIAPSMKVTHFHG